MPETIRRTNLGNLKPGGLVNLERALTLESPLGGHIIQGHVDATGILKKRDNDGEAVLMEFEAPFYVIKYVVEKLALIKKLSVEKIKKQTTTGFGTA